MATVSDRIEKRVVLKAPVECVWRAISDAREFGAWFGVEFDGQFAPGKQMRGKIVPTQADPEVAKTQEPYRGKQFDFTVDQIAPMKRFSFRWHPFAVESGVDYSSEPTTLIVFELRETPQGTELTITESGFDRIPLARRAKAFTMNEEGWAAQTTLLAKYLGHAA